jgi:hypothetical protein
MSSPEAGAAAGDTPMSSAKGKAPASSAEGKGRRVDACDICHLTHVRTKSHKPCEHCGGGHANKDGHDKAGHARDCEGVAAAADDNVFKGTRYRKLMLTFVKTGSNVPRDLIDKTARFMARYTRPGSSWSVTEELGATLGQVHLHGEGELKIDDTGTCKRAATKTYKDFCGIFESGPSQWKIQWKKADNIGGAREYISKQAHSPTFRARDSDGNTESHPKWKALADEWKRNNQGDFGDLIQLRPDQVSFLPYFSFFSSFFLLLFSLACPNFHSCPIFSLVQQRPFQERVPLQQRVPCGCQYCVADTSTPRLVWFMPIVCDVVSPYPNQPTILLTQFAMPTAAGNVERLQPFEGGESGTQRRWYWRLVALEP